MRADEFCKNAMSLEGLTYKQCDCIGVVRKAANISCQGTNWLWRSINNAPKYRYLVKRGTGSPPDPVEGLLLFRINFEKIPEGYNDYPDCHHVGVLVWSDGWRVVQSNPKPGVIISVYKQSEWDGWGNLKQVDYDYSVEHIQPTTNQEYQNDILLEIYNMLKALYQKFMNEGID